MIAQICCLYNPANYRNLVRNYLHFRKQFADLHTIELSFDGRFVVDDSIQILGNQANIMWQKERLLNLLIEQLPPKYTSIAWIDADLIFQNQNMLTEAERQLEDFPVVQLFERVRNTDHNGKIVSVDWGHAAAKHRGDPRIKLRRPGGAWAARREVCENGLDDMHVLGGSDAMQLAAWEGDFKHPLIRATTRSWRQAYLTRAIRDFELVRGNIGYVAGDAVHLWHGTRKNRKYWERLRYLTDYDFDPLTDIRIGKNGVWEWASNKPEMHASVNRYFYERSEDSPTVG